MDNKKESRKYKRYALSIIFSATLLLLTYMAIFKRGSFMDILMVGGFFGILHLLDKKYDLSTEAFSLAILAICIHLFGVLGMYSQIMIPGIMGYDKLVHFISAISTAYLLLEIIKEKHALLRYTLIIFAVMGAGAMVEIVEFVGWHYFGVNNGGIFTLTDGLAEMDSDLQRFDTYFDMIINLTGSMLASVFSIVMKRNKIGE